MNESVKDTMKTSSQEGLWNFGILDTLPEKEFDDFTVLASKICGAPVAMITFVDDKREC